MRLCPMILHCLAYCALLRLAYCQFSRNSFGSRLGGFNRKIGLGNNSQKSERKSAAIFSVQNRNRFRTSQRNIIPTPTEKTTTAATLSEDQKTTTSGVTDQPTPGQRAPFPYSSGRSRILPLQEQAFDKNTKSTKVAHDAPKELNALEDDQETEQTFEGVGIRNRLKSTLLKRLRLPDRNRFASKKPISSQLAPGSKEKEDSKRLSLKTKNNPSPPIRKVQPKASDPFNETITQPTTLVPLTTTAAATTRETGTAFALSSNTRSGSNIRTASTKATNVREGDIVSESLFSTSSHAESVTSSKVHPTTERKRIITVTTRRTTSTAGSTATTRPTTTTLRTTIVPRISESAETVRRVVTLRPLVQLSSKLTPTSSSQTTAETDNTSIAAEASTPLSRDSSLTPASNTAPIDSSTERNEGFFSRKALKKKLKDVVLSVIKDDSDTSIREKVALLREKLVAESPAEIQLHIERKAKEFTAGAIRLFSAHVDKEKTSQIRERLPESTSTTLRPTALVDSSRIIAVDPVDELPESASGDPEALVKEQVSAQKPSLFNAKEQTAAKSRALTSEDQVSLRAEEQAVTSPEPVEKADRDVVDTADGHDNGFIEDASVDSLIEEIYGTTMLDLDNEAQHDHPVPSIIDTTTEDRLVGAKKKDTALFFGKPKLDSEARAASEFKPEDVLKISTQVDNNPFRHDNVRKSNSIRPKPALATTRKSEDIQRAVLEVVMEHRPALEVRGPPADNSQASLVSNDVKIQSLLQDASSPISIGGTVPVTSKYNRPTVPDFVFANFDYDEQGNILLLNQDGFPIARAPKGSQIPTSHAIPKYLQTAKITPVFIRPGFHDEQPTTLTADVEGINRSRFELKTAEERHQSQLVQHKLEVEKILRLQHLAARAFRRHSNL